MRIRSCVVPVVAGAVAAATAVAGPATAHDGAHSDGSGGGVSPRLLAEMRAATAPFHNSDKAEAAGFLPTPHCVPGMGQHWVNPENIADGVHDPRNPDVLLFEPKRGGGVRLVGVEWLAWDADGLIATDDDRPSLGGIPFDGPMLGHEPLMPVHYDLHLYIWKHNPDGVAVNHNSRITC